MRQVRALVMSLITTESYDMKSCYQLIVLITKCENLCLGTLSCFCFGILTLDETNGNVWKPNRMMNIFFKKNTFLN